MQIIRGDDGAGVLVEEAAVGLEMDEAAGAEELPVALQEERGAQAFVLAAAKLRIREGQPDFGNLVRAEEGGDEFDAGAQEGNIAQTLFSGIFRALPEAGALDVDADEVHFRMALGQGDRVVSLAAAELQHDGLGDGEHLPVPVAFDGVVRDVEAGSGGAVEDRIGGGLEETGEGLVFGEFAEFVVAHGQSWLRMMPTPVRPSGASGAVSVSSHAPGMTGFMPRR